MHVVYDVHICVMYIPCIIPNRFLIVNNADINFPRAAQTYVFIIIMLKTTTTNIFWELSMCQACFKAFCMI